MLDVPKLSTAKSKQKLWYKLIGELNLKGSSKKYTDLQVVMFVDLQELVQLHQFSSFFPSGKTAVSEHITRHI